MNIGGKNLKPFLIKKVIYGQETPPLYSLDVITVPVAAYWSLNDWLASTSVSQSFFGPIGSP